MDGLHANVIQHENDHLDGILYPMRVLDFATFGFNEELARFPAHVVPAHAARATASRTKNQQEKAA